MSEKTPIKYRLIAVSFVLLLFIFGFVGVFGYVDYLHDSAREEACVDRFGDGSDWIGNSWGNSGGLGYDYIVCETPDGEIMRVEYTGMKRVSVQTYSAYIETIKDEFRE